MNELLLVADETERGYLPFPLTRSLVDCGADVHTAERSDFACSQAEKGICGRERGMTYSEVGLIVGRHIVLLVFLFLSAMVVVEVNFETKLSEDWYLREYCARSD